MSTLEGLAIEVIRGLESRWPLPDQARCELAAYVALQLLRTPAWREWYAGAVDVAAHRVPIRKQQVVERVTAIMEGDSARHNVLVGAVPRIGTLLANLRWTVLRCGQPRLTTSDHPVVPVPLPSGTQRFVPMAAVPPQGLLHTWEIRFALSPRLLLVLTWADDHTPEQILKMSHTQVRNHNGAAIEQAEKQWFHHPCQPVEQLRGACAPFCFDLHGQDYVPQRTRRWACIKQTIDEMVEESDFDEVDIASAIALIEWDSVTRLA